MIKGHAPSYLTSDFVQFIWAKCYYSYIGNMAGSPCEDPKTSFSGPFCFSCSWTGPIPTDSGSSTVRPEPPTSRTTRPLCMIVVHIPVIGITNSAWKCLVYVCAYAGLLVYSYLFIIFSCSYIYIYVYVHASVHIYIYAHMHIFDLYRYTHYMRIYIYIYIFGHPL